MKFVCVRCNDFQNVKTLVMSRSLIISLRLKTKLQWRAGGCNVVMSFCFGHSHQHGAQLEEIVVFWILHLHHSPGVQAAPHLLALGLNLLVGSHHCKGDASLEMRGSTHLSWLNPSQTNRMPLTSFYMPTTIINDIKWNSCSFRHKKASQKQQNVP